MDGDGCDDVIVGAYQYDDSWVDSGRFLAHLGSATGLLGKAPFALSNVQDLCLGS